MIAKNTGKILKNKMAANKQEFAHFYVYSKNNRHILEIRTNRWVFCLFVCPPSPNHCKCHLRFVNVILTNPTKSTKRYLRFFNPGLVLNKRGRRLVGPGGWWISMGMKWFYDRRIRVVYSRKGGGALSTAELLKFLRTRLPGRCAPIFDFNFYLLLFYRFFLSIS